MQRTADYWKKKLAAAREEVKTLQQKLNAKKAESEAVAVFVCARSQSKESTWHKRLAKVRAKRKMRARLAMLLTTKIPYYEARIESRTKRTAFDAVQSPLV